MLAPFVDEVLAAPFEMPLLLLPFWIAGWDAFAGRINSINAWI